MIVIDDKNNSYNLDDQVGLGGQGAVFFVKNQPKIVVKCLIDDNGEIIQDDKKYDEYRNKILNVFSIARIKNIASPICMLKKPFCGYVMRFMEEMESLEKNLMIPTSKELINFYITSGGLNKRIKVLKNIAEILCEMYCKGIVYSDISPKNIFVSKSESDSVAWLIDVDNMHYQNASANVISTPMYRAPEIVKGEKNTFKSDVYSFALIAFELLTMSKPFDGLLNKEESEDDNWDDEPIENIYNNKVELGEIPYVDSINDKTNKQVYGINIEYVTTPKLRELFRETFEEGKLDVSKRPSIGEWLKALEYAENSIFLSNCSKDKHYNFTKKCFICNQNAKNLLNVKVIDVNRYFFENTVIEENKEVCSFNLIEKSIIRIPYIFIDKNKQNFKGNIKILIKDDRYDFEDDIGEYKLKFEDNKYSKDKKMDGKIINIIKNNLIVRKLIFKKED